jgi:5'-3' exonuclease
MGIPFYFASLIRKHKNVLRKLLPHDTCVNLCLDSNSIIYDVVRGMKPCTDFEENLIKEVCAKLDEYLAMVRPRRVFIAFDGPPPMAKMKQQRERRYKGKSDGRKDGWDTVQITPGTKFMLRLDKTLTKHFENYHTRFEFFKLSTSSEAGEGEHKIFEWLRTRPGGNTFVYGLDSDLIILALHHPVHHLVHHPVYHPVDHPMSEDIFMMREFKEEMKILDISKLATQIEQVVGVGKLFDYVFMVFFLGNDFLPHFPALNLRTRGLDTLLNTYVQVVPKQEHLYDGKTICWKNVQLLVHALATKEEREIVREYNDRGKIAVEDTEENTPRLRRELEHYINPCENGWEHRYYTSLLKIEPTKMAIEQVCSSFYQMLAWNASYYTEGCPNWDVYYPYMYPPLLKDLERYTPTSTPVFKTSVPKSKNEVLEFVMPAEKHKYIESSLQSNPPLLVENYWAFSTFLWESHLLFV